MSTLIISILSGLVGASVAAYFNYRIRLSLLEKSNKDSEMKLAYVYVVQLGQYSAINFWIKNFLEKAIEQLDEPIPEGEFELTHAASIYIEHALSNIDDDFFDKVDSIEKLLDQMMDDFKNTYLSNEQQANLPKQTILYYQRYEHYLKSTAVTFKFFKVCLSKKDLSDVINAKQINSAIETVKSLFDAAGLLRAAMAEYGGISSKESSYILQQQYEFFRKNLAKEFEHENKLGKAKSYLEKNNQLSAKKSSEKDANTARSSL